MGDFIRSLIIGIVSSGIISAILGFLLHRRITKTEADIRHQYEKSIAIFQSNRQWKERSVSELLGPIYMHLDRAKRAFHRYEGDNLYLEVKVLSESNLAVRDLLLTKSYLIPPELRQDAGRLIEHYDCWLEEFEKLKGEKEPALHDRFIFAYQYPFPIGASERFEKIYIKMWAELFETLPLSEKVSK